MTKRKLTDGQKTFRRLKCDVGSKIFSKFPEIKNSVSFFFFSKEITPFFYMDSLKIISNKENFIWYEKLNLLI